MSKFNFDDWKNKKVVMHCKTLEEAEDFCRVMDSAGLKWWNCESYLEDNYWNRDKEKTCYIFNESLYCKIEQLKRENYTILEWSDYMNNEDIEHKSVFVVQGFEDECLAFLNKYNTPQHYKINGTDTMQFILSVVENNAKDFEEAIYHFNFLKYAFRYGNKNGVDDLKKAKDYLERMIDYIESREEN